MTRPVMDYLGKWVAMVDGPVTGETGRVMSIKSEGPPAKPHVSVFVKSPTAQWWGPLSFLRLAPEAIPETVLWDTVNQHGGVDELTTVRKPYVMTRLSATLPDYAGEPVVIEGVGFAKWNPNDRGDPAWDWKEGRGRIIAHQRARLDMLRHLRHAVGSWRVPLHPRAMEEQND